MKKGIAIATIFTGCVLASGPKGARPVDPSPADDPVTVTMGQRKPARVRVAKGQATLFRLPDGQRVMNTFGGNKCSDSGVWCVDPGKVPTQFVSVKPRELGIHTTFHILTNTGQEVSFLLQEVTGGDTQFDAKVDIDPLTAENNPAVQEIKWVPAEEALSCKTHSDLQKIDFENTTKKLQQQTESDIAAYRQSYPEKLSFDYSWDEAKAAKLGFRSAWADDKFTYFKGSRVMALYEINEDGKPSLIQYSYKNGLYTVSKVLYDGYFAIGTKKQNKLTFHRDRSRS